MNEDSMYKLGRLESGEWIEHSHSKVFCLPESAEELQCLVAGVPNGDAGTFLRLVSLLAPPYNLLYILHTPRLEGTAGRYQSPQIDLQDLQAFLSEFDVFLAQDARFDLWAYSPAERATVVWDRHNQLFAYGPLDRFVAELKELGFAPGAPEIPLPHQHHYQAEFDSQAKQLLNAFEWSFSPLKPEDEQ
jgi:hypothetical protein